MHGEVLGDVAALGDHRDARGDARTAVLLGPERSPVQIVDESQAVRSHECHVPGGRHQLALERRAVLAVLGEPGRVADDAAHTEPGQIGDDLDGRLAGDGDEGRVGNARELRQVGEARQPADRVPGGVDRQISP